METDTDRSFGELLINLSKGFNCLPHKSPVVNSYIVFRLISTGSQISAAPFGMLSDISVSP